MTKPIGILAPVGGEETLLAAVRSGANSIYCGLTQFNARASAANFTPEQLAKAVAFCHARGVSVNVVLNTVLYNKELPAFTENVKAVAAAGADAVIVQDLAALAIVQKAAPGIAIHGSTQMAVHSLGGAKQLAALGCTRVILGRELTKESIAYITANCGIETEVFVHGALCVCLSGQCYISAFLGGRSGNRGRCAGACRLPFSAAVGPLPKGQVAPALGQHHLSLKDLSIISEIPALEAMGVTCVKIEGRLRTPEYVASAVAACRTARDGKPVDEGQLAAAFSRNGFTKGFYTGQISKNMFGTRSEEDAAKTREILPALREIYRREHPSVGVNFILKVAGGGFTLAVSDGENTLCHTVEDTLATAQKPGQEAVLSTLAKCGGTPFYMAGAAIENPENLHLPNAVLSEARRALLQQLLEKREMPAPKAFTHVAVATPTPAKRKPVLRARFENVAQMPKGAEVHFEKLIFPIEDFAKIPQQLMVKTVLELPRSLLEGEEKTAALVAAAKEAGHTAFEAGNIGHIPLIGGQGIHGGFTLNVTNTLAAATYKKLGLQSLVLSPELTLTAINTLAAPLPVGLLAYGHLPLMLTASCPLHNAAGCAGCKESGYLADRKGQNMPVLCKNGARHIYNPVPIYMGERMHEVHCDFAELYFSIETAGQAADVIENFVNSKPYPGTFTRGLYYKGAE